MRLRNLISLFLLIAVVFTLASCGLGGSKKPSKYTVEFNSDGGTKVESQEVTKGALINAPVAPTKEGYTFAGWYKGDAKWDFNSPVTESMTLVAHWEKIVIPCSHIDKNDDGKCDVCDEDFTDGYENYTITYMDGETKLALSPSLYAADKTDLQLPTPAAKPHYEFAGWYKDSALTEVATGIDFNAAANLTYYASYVPVSYSITYSLDGGTNAETNPTVLNITQLPVTLSDPTKADYEFAGWFTDYACTNAITEITENNIGNLTIYAKWASVVQKRTVTYLDKDGNTIAVDTFFVSTEDQPLRPGEAPEGFKFIGWFDTVDTTKNYVVIPAGTDTDLVLKARVVEEEKKMYNAMYWVDGNYHGIDIFDEENGLTSLTVPTKGGYEFDGWYANADYTGEKVTSIPAGTVENQNLYGKFVPLTYAVKYFDGITSLELVLDPATYDTSAEAIALPAIAVKEGYVIEGWFNQDGKKMTEIPAGYFGDLELTAVYTPDTFTITYVLVGGQNHELNVEQYTYNPEGSVPTLYDPSRDGYLFAGWYTTATYAGVPVEDLTRFANQDVTLYAKWIPVNEGNGGGSTLTPEVPF